MPFGRRTSHTHDSLPLNQGQKGKRRTPPTCVGCSTTAKAAVVREFDTREDLQRGTPFLLELLEDEMAGADADVRLSFYGSSEWLFSLGMVDDGASFVNQACCFVIDRVGNW